MYETSQTPVAQPQVRVAALPMPRTSRLNINAIALAFIMFFLLFALIG